MSKTTTGLRNTAVGNNSLICNTSGTGNTAVGGTDAGTIPVMWKNTTGQCNSAFGTAALADNTTGGCNVAVGLCAGRSNTTGCQSVFIGQEAGHNTTTAAGNTFVGRTAGCNAVSGNNNTAIGQSAGIDQVKNITGSETHQLVLGNNSLANAFMKVSFTVTSDLRDKTEIETVPHGLDFVNELNPIKYRFKESRENPIGTGNKKYGFSAQELLKLEGDNNVIIDNHDPENLKLTELHLIPVLVNAIKELTKKIKDLEDK